MRKILILNGPNLNLLGTREPQRYGQTTLEEINTGLIKKAAAQKNEAICFQSNAEADLINRIQQAAGEQISFIIINPAAFTHTSVALRDALLAVNIPFIEVHLSNIFSRETFRQHSYFSDIALGVISGLGAKGYELALDFALSYKKD
jgi:3-dehydroquinate dehydratase-2